MAAEAGVAAASAAAVGFGLFDYNRRRLICRIDFPAGPYHVSKTCMVLAERLLRMHGDYDV